ncbi:MAG: hypothetical protein K2Y29_19925, partial [Beijerinckiaceae bacterium]|nr:hypothetical protein [Beijerinckiaceae bacterium]
MRANAGRIKLLLLVSVSACALGGAQAQQRGGDGGFLIEGLPAASRAPAPQEAAQQKLAPETRPSASRITVKPIDAEEGGPDETALRFYAAQNQMKRVAIETERLRRLYPYWRPPETLVEPASTSSEDEQPLWDLFGADRLDDLRVAIEQRQRTEPDWRPSKDLTDKIARKEMRMRLLGLWRDGNLNEIVEAVRRDGFGGDRADIDLQWTVAESYARMKQSDEAVNIYRSILCTSVDPRERTATIQKAMETLRISDVEPLFSEFKADEKGRSELSPLAFDITRARISAYLHDERAERIPDAEFKAFADNVRGVGDPSQIGLVAWYLLKNKSHREALEWFKQALERGGDAMIAHGLANALRELGLKRETEEVAFAWRDALINNALLYIDVVESELTQPIPVPIEPERLMRYAQVTLDLASGEGAQALGWYAYNTCQFETAFEWFQRAVAWSPKETTVMGLMLSAQRTKRSKDVFELANRYDGLFPKALAVIFPDGYQRPPAPCDMVAANGRAPAGFRAPQAIPAMAPSAPSAQRHAFGAGPFPSLPGQQQNAPQFWQPPALTPVANDQMPKFARGEFPAVVDPENNRRFPGSGKLMGRPMAVSTPPAGQTLLRAEVQRAAPLVARRVQGVGPMPYERWGFSLLPGANGQTMADAPHSAQTAPPGTVWASEPTGSRPPENATDPMQAMQAISSAPRVPAPTATRMVPTMPAAPNFMRGASLRPGLEVDMEPTASIGRREDQ